MKKYGCSYCAENADWAVFLPGNGVSAAHHWPYFSVPGKKGEFVPEQSMFRVDIVPDETIGLLNDRSLRVLKRNRKVLFDRLPAYSFPFFHQEF